MTDLQLRWVTIKPGYATVKIAYAASNPVDYKVFTGKVTRWRTPLPFTPGAKHKFHIRC